MFVLLFTYVFGGAIHVPGVPYVDYLMPGVFVQTVTFGAVSTAVGLSEDLQKGLIERFRALPMARSAVLAGRTTADLVRNVFVGGAHHRGRLRRRLPHRDQRRAVPLRRADRAAVLLHAVLGLRHIGLSAPNAETAQVMVFPILFPLIFASSAFVPVSHHARLAAGLRQAPAGDPGGRRGALAHDRRRRCTTRAPSGRRWRGASGCWSSWSRWRCASTARSPERPRSVLPLAGAPAQLGQQVGDGHAHLLGACRGRAR